MERPSFAGPDPRSTADLIRALPDMPPDNRTDTEKLLSGIADMEANKETDRDYASDIVREATEAGTIAERLKEWQKVLAELKMSTEPNFGAMQRAEMVIEALESASGMEVDLSDLDAAA